jgi:hypothetical protein
MINAALTAFKKDGVLLQMDSDELWTEEQMRRLVELFAANPETNTAQFEMDYMLGPNVKSTSTDGYGNRKNEWIRAWRYSVGLWMERHEPPIFNGNKGKLLDRGKTSMTVGKILHMAWVTPQQVAQKQRIYKGGYDNACEDWERLQSNTEWPVKDLKQFLPWVGSGASADLLSSNNPLLTFCGEGGNFFANYVESFPWALLRENSCVRPTCCRSSRSGGF